MFKSGAFVADHLDGVTADQVQPNGVDLTIDGVFQPAEPGRVLRDGKRVGERDPVAPETREGREVFALDRGGYVARYGEVVRIPPGHVGFIYPRSTLLRNACMLHTAVWDAGYEGRGEGLLEVHHPIWIESGARVGQLVLAAADHSGTYEGSYQRENV